jgi:hypothetical protein
MLAGAALAVTLRRYWRAIAQGYNEALVSYQAEQWLKEATRDCGCVEWEDDDDTQ